MNMSPGLALIRRHVPVLLTLILGLMALVVLVGAPAYHARGALDEFAKAEQAERCENRPVEAPALAPFARSGQQQNEPSGEGAGRDDRRERPRDPQDGSDCSAIRSNLIAIEALRSSNAATFVSFVVGVASILAVAVAVLAARENGRARLTQVALEVSFEQTGVDAGEVVLTNFGDHPAWLLGVRVGAAVSFSCSGDGLMRLAPGAAVRFARSLVEVGGARLPIRAEYQDAYGRRWTLTAELGRRTGRWSVDRLENRPKH